MSAGVNSQSMAPVRASSANVRPYVVVMIATSRERPLTVRACSSIADESTVPGTRTFCSLSWPTLWLVMPVLDGPTPLRWALKSNRSQSPPTAATDAGSGVVDAAWAELVCPAACPPQATSTAAQATDSPRAINDAFIRPRLAPGPARGAARPPCSEPGPAGRAAAAWRRSTQPSRRSAQRPDPTGRAAGLQPTRRPPSRG